MGVIVQFNLAAWRALYPEFAAVTDQQVNDCFALATLYQRNDGNGPVDDGTIALSLLNLLTAHVVQLRYGSSITPATGVVGRISNATEGSVSASADYPGVTPSQAWYVQTSYGAAWWQATAAYRTMHYIPGPRRVYNPWPYRPF